MERLLSILVKVAIRGTLGLTFRLKELEKVDNPTEADEDENNKLVILDSAYNRFSVSLSI